MKTNKNKIMKQDFFLQSDSILPNSMNTSNGKEIFPDLKKAWFSPTTCFKTNSAISK